MSACITDITSVTAAWDAIQTLLRLLGISDRSDFHQYSTECVFSLEDGSKTDTVPDAPEFIGNALNVRNDEHPHDVKRGSSILLGKQSKGHILNQKYFTNEINTTLHDLMPNEYPKEFVDSVMKPSVRNRPTSDTVYQGTVVIPYVKGRRRCVRLYVVVG
jgi:hypothetical protein